MKILKKSIMTAIILLLAVTSVFAQGRKETDTSAVKTVRFAHTQSYVPYGFVNEKGESDGFEIAVLKAVDGLLPEYSFEFVPTTDDDLLIGVETGKYNAGTKGVWHTEERAKKYIFPKNYIAASIIGIAFRTENAGQIHDLESFAKFSGKLVPIPPQSAQYPIIEQFNAAHPDTPIALVPSDVFIINDAYTWVLEGRYDAFFDIKLSFQNNVLSEKGVYHHLADKLSYAPYRAIPTWPLFNRNEQALADAYDRAYTQLKQDGTISRLSQQYFGEDIFTYIEN